MRTARALMASLFLAVSALAAGPGFRFEVPEPFQLGPHHHGPGTIALRNVGVTSSPVALIEVWVDGSCLGALQATRSVEAGISLRDEAIFRRDDAGELVMVGFRVAGDRDGSFRFADGELIPQGSTLAAAHTQTSHR